MGRLSKLRAQLDAKPSAKPIEATLIEVLQQIESKIAEGQDQVASRMDAAVDAIGRIKLQSPPAPQVTVQAAAAPAVTVNQPEIVFPEQPTPVVNVKTVKVTRVTVSGIKREFGQIKSAVFDVTSEVVE